MKVTVATVSDLVSVGAKAVAVIAGTASTAVKTVFWMPVSVELPTLSVA